MTVHIGCMRADVETVEHGTVFQRNQTTGPKQIR
jgi:hypothetical protein